MRCRYWDTGRCSGTRECEPCKCNGDKTKCDFYADIRAGITKVGPKQCEWVKINDKMDLPDDEGKYIVCTSKGTVYSAKFKVGKYDSYFATDSNTHITHWMLMPEPPEEYKNEI